MAVAAVVPLYNVIKTKDDLIDQVVLVRATGPEIAAETVYPDLEVVEVAMSYPLGYAVIHQVIMTLRQTDPYAPDYRKTVTVIENQNPSSLY